MKAGTLVVLIMIIFLIVGVKLLDTIPTETSEDKTVEEHTIILASFESGTLDERLKVVLEDGSIHYYHPNFIKVDTERDYSYTQKIGKYSANTYVYLSKDDYKTIFGMMELEAGKEVCRE